MHSPTARRRGFTLVELLVVIAIIGILASLITVAASSAIIGAKQTRVKAELDQIAAGFKAYKTEYGSYPPNGYNSLLVRQHLLKTFPRINAGERSAIESLQLTAAEAAWFWLAGFRSDPQQPVFATKVVEEGGVKKRKWIFGSAANLSSSGDVVFDGATNAPLFEFDQMRLVKTREIPVSDLRTLGANIPTDPPMSGIQPPGPFLIFAYKPHGNDLSEPYVYFDVSREDPNSSLVPQYPPSTVLNHPNSYIFPYKNRSGQYVDSEAFQVLAAGLDNHWGDNPKINYPEGPYIGNDADNLASFSTKNMEDSMP